MATNRDDTALKELVDRVVSIEREFLDAKAERGDLIKDIKLEVKQRHDATGLEWPTIAAQVKIRLDEQAAREEMQKLESDLATYEVVYGRGIPDSDDPDDV